MNAISDINAAPDRQRSACRNGADADWPVRCSVCSLTSVCIDLSCSALSVSRVRCRIGLNRNTQGGNRHSSPGSTKVLFQKKEDNFWREAEKVAIYCKKCRDITKISEE